jgi:inosose dehydratase
MAVHVANGPVSWGVDFADMPGAPAWETVFGEIAAAGYRWCELGPLGYLPDDDEVVRSALHGLGLRVAGSHVFEPIHDRARRDEVAETTRRTCRRIAGFGGTHLVVIDLVSDERGATAGRSDAAPRLTGRRYDDLLAGLREVVGIAVAHGLTPVLHPHAGSYVEFEDEIERVLAATVSDGLQLCLDTGHAAYAGIEPVDFFATHRDRIEYLHFKDVDGEVLGRVRDGAIAFFDAIPLGVFCPVGNGIVDFGALATELARGYHGPGTIEQDRRPGSRTTALGDATASLAYLRRVGIAD